MSRSITNAMAHSPLTDIERRALGRYDTPRPLAQALTDWAVRSRNEIVLEPSSGGGSIVQSIASRLNELGANQFDQQIVACDIDPRALEETSHSTPHCSPTLILGNFLALDSEDLNETLFDAIVGNPPYVRLHAMDKDSRQLARNSLPNSIKLDAKASLWAYFPIHAFKFLKKGGRMALILPETILHSNYGRQILQWAATNFGRCIAVSLRERCFTEAGAKERVVILLLEDAGIPAKQGVEMIEFERAIDCISGLEKMSEFGFKVLPKLNGHAVPHLISTEAAKAASALERCPDLATLGDIANIRIGVVTGNNKFFVLNEHQRTALKLRPYHFKAVVSKFSDLGSSFAFTQPKHQGPTEHRSLLLCPNPSSVDKSLAKYLLSYTDDEIEANRTMQKRKHWQCPTLGEKPDAFLQSMGKSGPRLILNQTDAYCTNTLHSVVFTGKVTMRRKKAICLALHSSFAQLSAEFEGRQYGSGVLKLEPSEAKRLRFPARPEILEALADQWPKLAKKARREGAQSVIGEIDQIVCSHSLHLKDDLPLELVISHLKKVRQRRTGSICVGVDIGPQ